MVAKSSANEHVLSFGDNVSYRTDDRDKPHQASLEMFAGGNGDWYQQITWIDHKGLNRVSPAIRYCTSGGTATIAPKVLHAVCDQYRAIAGLETRFDRVKKQRDDALEMLQKVLDGEASRDDVDLFIAMNRI